MAEKGDTGDLEPEETGFKPPPPKSLDEIKNSDKDDPALEKYKQQLLGAGVPDPMYPDRAENVIVQKIQIKFLNEQRQPTELPLLDCDLGELKKNPIVIKEGVSYQVQIFFFVQRDIVSGLRYVQAIYKMGIKASKDDMMVGSYGPKKEAQVFTSPVQEAPTGMLARGTYTVKSRFTDDDKNDYLTWEWAIKIKDNWKD